MVLPPRPYFYIVSYSCFEYPVANTDNAIQLWPMPATVLFLLLPPLCCNKNDAKMHAKLPVDCHFYSLFSDMAFAHAVTVLMHGDCSGQCCHHCTMMLLPPACISVVLLVLSLAILPLATIDCHSIYFYFGVFVTVHGTALCYS